MAKVKGPLLSMDASGSVANAFVFTKWKGRNVVRQHVVPSNPQTDNQTGVRASFAGLIALYKANLADIITNFGDAAAAKKHSPINEFVGFNQKRLSQMQYPSIDMAPSNEAPADNATDLAGTVDGVYVNLAWTDSDSDDAWCNAIYRKLGADPTGLKSELVAVVPQGVEKYTDGPLGSGAWHYVIAAISKNGGRHAVSAAITKAVA